jgi:hypothetical protein
MPGITNRSGQLFNPVLTNLGRGYRPGGFIAEQVAPRIPVTKEVGQYTVWDSFHFFANDVETLTPDRAETREVDVAMSTETYTAEEHALKVSVSDREQSQSDVDVRLAKLNALSDRLAVARERRVAALLNTQDAGGGLDNAMDSTPSNNWNVDAGTIEADIVTAKEAVFDAIGIEPNVIIIPWKVANAVATQQDIREVLKYTVSGQQILLEGQNILPNSLWGLRVLIPRGRYASNAQGQTNTFADIWGDDVRVLYVNDSGPSMFTPSVAYTFEAAGFEVRTWREDDPNVEWVRNRDGILDEKVVAPQAGYILKDVLS